jgi:competence protein ComEC
VAAPPNPTPTLERPAIPLALGVWVGAGAVLDPWLACALALGAILLAGPFVVGFPWASRRARRALVLLLLAASVGACRMGVARAGGDSRGAGFALLAGGAIEGHLTGMLLGDEPSRDGERVLVVRGRFRASRAAPAGPLLTARLHLRGGDGGYPAAWRPGDRVRMFVRLRRPGALRNPGAADPGARLLARGIDASGSVKSARLIERLAPAPGLSWRRLAGLARRGVRAGLDRRLEADDPVRALLGAMLIGDRAAIPPELQRRLRDAGLSHLLAISGLHVGIVLLLLLATLRRTASPRGARPAIVWVACIGVVLLVGARPPVLRATAAACVAVLGRGLGRDGDGANTLAVVGGALLLLNPWLAGDPGFQLSFLATAGILTRAGALRRCLALPSWLATGIAVSTTAYVATVPALAWHFGRLAPVALLANLAAVPLCAAILSLTLAALFLAPLPVLGAASWWAAEGCGRGLLAWADLMAGVPHGALVLPRPPWPALLGWLGLAAALAAGERGGAPRGRAVAASLVAVTLMLHAGPLPRRPGTSEIELLDVGQGQALLARGPGGGVVLVDAGASASGRFDLGERVVTPAVLRGGAIRVAALWLSHEHDDHAGGAEALLRDLEIGSLWLPAGFHRHSRLAALAATAVERGVAVVGTSAGDRARVAGLDIEVLHPTPSELRGPANERSLVLRLGVAPARILIPGDLEAEGERRLVARAASSLRAEALVVGHHGSRHGTSAALLDAVDPDVALCSAGRHNRFGHPAPRVRQALRRRGLPLWRTDREGLVRLRAGRRGWIVASWASGLGEARLDPGDRDEREQEHQEQRPGQQPAATPDLERFVPDRRVPIAEPQQDEEPDRVQRGPVKRGGDDHDKHGEADERGPRGPPVHAAGDREGHVAAVELPDRKQVHRRDQQAEPARQVGRAHPARPVDPEQGLEQPGLEQGRADDEQARGVRRTLVRSTLNDSDDEQRNRDQPARDRARRGDVEQHAPIGDHPADADHGAERPERPGTWDEVGRRRGNTVATAGQVMAHLVCPDHEQQPTRERQSAPHHPGVRAVRGQQVVEGEVGAQVARHAIQAAGEGHRAGRGQEQNERQPAPSRTRGKRQRRRRPSPGDVADRWWGGRQRIGGVQRSPRLGADRAV